MNHMGLWEFEWEGRVVNYYFVIYCYLKHAAILNQRKSKGCMINIPQTDQHCLFKALTLTI